MKSLLMLLARCMLCAVFLAAAAQKILHWEATSVQLKQLGLEMIPLLLAYVVNQATVKITHTPIVRNVSKRF